MTRVSVVDNRKRYPRADSGLLLNEDFGRCSLSRSYPGPRRAVLRPPGAFRHLGVRAAVDGQRRAGDVLSFLARQERYRVGDIIRRAKPA